MTTRTEMTEKLKFCIGSLNMVYKHDIWRCYKHLQPPLNCTHVYQVHVYHVYRFIVNNLNFIGIRILNVYLMYHQFRVHFIFIDILIQYNK